MDSGIERLATHLGILPSYAALDGAIKVTSAKTRLAILDAMGFRATSDAEADALLETLLDEERKELLAPVLVVERGPSHRIHVNAPRREGGCRWKIKIRSERGRLAEREGIYEGGPPLEVDVPDLGPGYYDVDLSLTTSHAERTANQTLIVVPSRAVVPQDLLGDRRAFGVFANLYTLRGDRNWGIGDVGDLVTLADWVEDAGGSFVGVNPLHALLNRGDDISPYGPVSRLWRNPIYIDVERVPEYHASPAVAALIQSSEIVSALDALRKDDRVQYEQVWARKALALAVLHDAFLDLRERRPELARVAHYDEFVQDGGEWLTRYATWMAIAEVRHEFTWKIWPADLQDPTSDAVRQFATEHRKRIDFHMWLQFELDRQLGTVADRPDASRMEIGLYQDLAVGSSGTGSDAWAYPHLFLDGVTVGAPPDPYSDFGQNWALPPIDPRVLRRDRYRYFIQLVRSGFRHAGALRIDHVMGLFRLFWIPQGGTGRDGAYVRYPSADLLGILALESHRHNALIVGEDLGVVPPEVPIALEKWGILSSKVLYFERETNGAFREQTAYTELSLASANTHDMPTIAGFWTGRDVELRTQLGLVDPERSTDGYAQRELEKQALVHRLREDGALPLREVVASDAAGIPAIKYAVHEFLCDSPALLVGLSLDDLGGETEPVNVPGVGPDKFPCWNRKMRKSVSEIAATTAEDLAACVSRVRPASVE